MLTNNPFAELATAIPPSAMQTFVVIMFLLVVGGTIFDVIHKRSAQYFFENMKKNKGKGRELGGGEKVGIAATTLAHDVLASGEFCNTNRRIAHLLTMYGFILFVVATVVMIFSSGASGFWAFLWHLGALSVCVGGYWFWFKIRVDVAAEGQQPLRLMRADMFVLSLLGTTTFALLWSATQGSGIGWLFFILFIGSALVLFGGVPWSKFAHMFFKPAAAYQKRLTKADGTQENLPDLGDLSDPALQAKYPDIPMYMGKNPPNMGLGIKRESPNHY